MNWLLNKLDKRYATYDPKRERNANRLHIAFGFFAVFIFAVMLYAAEVLPPVGVQLSL